MRGGLGGPVGCNDGGSWPNGMPHLRKRHPSGLITMPDDPIGMQTSRRCPDCKADFLVRTPSGILKCECGFEVDAGGEYLATARVGLSAEVIETSRDWEDCLEAVIEHAGEEPSEVPERPPEGNEFWLWKNGDTAIYSILPPESD